MSTVLGERQRGLRARHPRDWNWPRIVLFILLPASLYVALLHALGPTP